MRRLAPLLLLLALPACAERWERADATEAEADAMNAACTRQAELEVPPHFVWQVVSPPGYDRDRQCWRDTNGQERCRVVERWRPARWAQVDVNARERDAARQACMREKGFTFTGYRPLRLH